MDQPQETDQRFIGLETKVAYVERMMGELDGVVRTLSADLDGPRKEVARPGSSATNASTTRPNRPDPS